MRAVLILSAMLALSPLAGVAAPADEPDANLPALKEVDLAWVAMPRGDRMARFYPVRARAQKVTRGMAMLDCTARANGHLDCEVPFETPGDLMFGDAALKVMKTATVKATDGGSPEGRRFSLTLRFGYWPPSTLPGLNRRGLEGTNLVWRVFPSLGDRWHGADPRPGEWFSVSLTCKAQADGYLQCVATDAGDTPKGFSDTVAKAMSTARVKTQDGSSPEGAVFSYRFSYTRTTP